jgi:hypothetical protein
MPPGTKIENDPHKGLRKSQEQDQNMKGYMFHIYLKNR